MLDKTAPEWRQEKDRRTQTRSHQKVKVGPELSKVGRVKLGKLHCPVGVSLVVVVHGEGEPGQLQPKRARGRVSEAITIARSSNVGNQQPNLPATRRMV